jgi:hypothetical protein
LPDKKRIENNALSQNIQNREKLCEKPRERNRETLEPPAETDRPRKEEAGKKQVLSRIMMNALRNNAENSTSKIRAVQCLKRSAA